jgi:SAM-dependent methyltransferase
MAGTKTDYGLDAPQEVRKYAIRGALLLAFAAGVYFVNLGSAPAQGAVIGGLAALAGLAFLALAGLMIRSSREGKFRLRDEIIEGLALRGEEHVLDVGCGRGLMIVAAAKKLGKSGRAVGVDVWNPRHLSGNSIDAAKANAQAESARVEFREADARKLPLKDASFDVVLSCLTLHHFDGEDQRQLALAEMARVVKPGGRIVIADVLRGGEYAAYLRGRGFSVEQSPLRILFGRPAHVVTARRPPA